MKVWELMRELEKAPAGADVVVKTKRDTEKEILETFYYTPHEYPDAFERPFFPFIINVQ